MALILYIYLAELCREEGQRGLCQILKERPIVHWIDLIILDTTQQYLKKYTLPRTQNHNTTTLILG